ncbi:autotransporter outer membrane beta-barrel domain-containing protein [Phormidium tenue]|jgi:hypothetical protein|uniref:Uncharacterized protein n=1 Tax=Phormidium tenue FACHB-1050 TaxID=2692857 RepID=A0ABR8C4V8_9CYAN|nr:hypothetical protein [Phormidium tenue]MBD2315758.1 hypothetical protein [Phormidium tenue FACHB-1050]
MLTRIKNYTFNLGAIAITLGATAIAASPSLAQTTSVPITGGSFTVNVTNAATNNVNSTAVTVLTPVGTAQISALSGTTAGTTNLAVGNNFDIVGKSTGSVNFDTGTTANFTNADTTIKGKVVTTTTPGNVSALAAPATVTGSIQKDSFIQVPTANISALPSNTVVIPITSGKFDVTRFNDGTTVGNSIPTVLTPFGTAQLTKFTFKTLENLNGSSLFAVDDEVRTTGLASGSIPSKVSTFTDAKTAMVGKLTTATANPNASFTLKGDITGGNLIVPSSATTIPNTSTETILILVNNPKLLKLVGLSPSFLAPGKSKFLLVLVNNQSLLNYIESKSSEFDSSDPVSFGNSNAVDKIVFVNFQKKNLYYFSEVSYQALLTAIANSSNTSNNSSNNTSNNSSNNTSNNSSNNTSTNTSNNSSNNTSNNSSNNTSNNTSTNTSNNTSNNTSTNTSTQVVRVVFVGLPSRLIPGFGTVAKFERRDRNDDDDRRGDDRRGDDRRGDDNDDD